MTEVTCHLKSNTFSLIPEAGRPETIRITCAGLPEMPKSGSKCSFCIRFLMVLVFRVPARPAGQNRTKGDHYRLGLAGLIGFMAGYLTPL